uniref:Uncharacterized protein n=1 Tax=Rhizophora mucronata TaxID=61149 RepID=A0A2P2N1I8_RHIMU
MPEEKPSLSCKKRLSWSSSKHHLSSFLDARMGSWLATMIRRSCEGGAASLDSVLPSSSNSEITPGTFITRGMRFRTRKSSTEIRFKYSMQELATILIKKHSFFSQTIKTIQENKEIYFFLFSFPEPTKKTEAEN